MEEGIAHIFLVSQSKTVVKAKIEKAIAKNTGMNNKNASSKAKFFDIIIKNLFEHFTGDNSSNY